MPAPTNVSFLTATDLGMLPASVVQEVDFSGTTYTVYYKFTAATTGVVSGFAYGDASVYTPHTQAYIGPAASPTLVVTNSTANKALQFPVTAGSIYFFEIITNGGNPAPANLTLSVQYHSDTALSTGDFAVPDETIGFALSFPSGTSDYTIKQFVNGFPAGEQGDTLANGVVLVVDNNLPHNVNLYSAAYVLVTTHTFTGLVNAIRTCPRPQLFYVATGGAPFTVQTVDHVGTVGAGLSITGSLGTPGAIAASNDQTKLYHAQATTNVPVKRSSLVDGSALTQLAAGIVNYQAQDILVLSDNTILVGYAKSSATADFKVLRYQDDGTLLNTYTIGQWDTSHNAPPRINTALDDPNSFWVMFDTAATLGEVRFLNIKISDGSTITTRKGVLFADGVYAPAATTSPTALFGSSPSCPFWVVRVGAVTTTTTVIRRQRRFLLPSSDSNHVMQIPVIELLMRTGIGLLPAAWTGDANTPQGANPPVLVRISKDGGMTWGPERSVSAGQRGEFLDRVRLLRATGNYRNAVLEVTVCDPVDWQFVSALAPAGIIEGSS